LAEVAGDSYSDSEVIPRAALDVPYCRTQNENVRKSKKTARPRKRAEPGTTTALSSNK
jgi:hypothetical protein